MHLTPDQITWALQNKSAMLAQLDRIKAEESLIEFCAQGWHVLEPGRPFVRGWAIEAICEHLEAVTNGQIQNLLINVPPGLMKSLTTNVFWPAWEWGPRKMPWLRYVTAAYSQALTLRDNRRMRQIVTSDWYKANWGDTVQLAADEQNRIKFSNTQTGFKIATSVGGSVLGERGDRRIVDDPNQTKETVDSDKEIEAALQWFTEVWPSRVNDMETSASVVIMQRVNERDVSGHIIAHDLGYVHLSLPMEFEVDTRCTTSIGFTDPRTEEGELLFPERFPATGVEQLKKELSSWGGEYAVSGQLQQRPAPRGGGMFQRDDFQIVDKAPGPITRRARGWDLAASTGTNAAFTCGVKMGITRDGAIVVEDVARDRLSPHGVQSLIKSCAKQDGAGCVQDMPQDPGQAGKAQKAALANLLHGHRFFFSPETGSKIGRAGPYAAQSEAGNIYLIRAPWNDAFIAEHTMFPAGKFKDQVDASSRAYARVTKRTAQITGAVGSKIIEG